MRAFSLIWSMLSVLRLSASAARAIAPNQVPKFETLFFGEFQLAEIDSLNATFGTRVNIALNG